jgi:hypothetical protein
MVLRYGELCPLIARDNHTNNKDKSWLSDIVAFARFSLMETAIISINLSDREQKFYVDMENLIKLYSKAFKDNTVVMV